MLLQGDYADVPPPDEQMRRYAEVKARLARTPAKPAAVVDVPKFLPPPEPEPEPEAVDPLSQPPHLIEVSIPDELALALSEPARPDDVPVLMVRIPVKGILRAVSAEYDIPVKVLLSPARKRDIAKARQVAMWIARQISGASLPGISHALGGRDHTTVLHGIRQVQKEVDAGTEFGARALALRTKIAGEYSHAGRGTFASLPASPYTENANEDGAANTIPALTATA